MSKDNLFDDISRVLATPMPRRQAFRLIAGGLAGGAVVSLLEPQQALGVNICGGSVCDGTCSSGFICGGITPDCECKEQAVDCSAKRCDGSCPNGFVCTGDEGKCKCEVKCHREGVLCVGVCKKDEVCGRGCSCCPSKSSSFGRISAIRSGPPAQADATIQNPVEGISTITVAEAVNCTVANMPMDLGGTKRPIVCTATKIDQTKPAQFLLSVCDPDQCCANVDPIFTVLELTTGRWVRQTFAEVPQAEHFVTVTNGSPGLRRLHIWVNSKHYTTLSLRDNETQNVDLAAAMTLANNTISLVGGGELGASATVAIVDTPPAAVTSGEGTGKVAAAKAHVSSPRHNAIWGPLAEETEENSHLHAAKAASQTVQINFNGALSSGAAGPSGFTVEVNRKAAAVQAAHVRAGAAGMDVTIQLRPGTLHKGDSVDVFWENLRDAKGRPLSGHVPLFAE